MGVVLATPCLAQSKLPSTFETTTAQNGFLENVGQIKDFKNKAVSWVYYQANLRGQLDLVYQNIGK